MKGGATGGGLAQVMPRDQINLHFTGDIMPMPGLPKLPTAERIDITDYGEIVGLS